MSAVDFAWLLPGVKVYSIISFLRMCPRYNPLKVIASALKRTRSGKNVFSEYLSKAVWCSKSMGVKNMQVKHFAESQTLFARVILLTEVCPVGWSCLFGCPKDWASGGDTELPMELLIPMTTGKDLALPGPRFYHLKKRLVVNVYQLVIFLWRGLHIAPNTS